MTSFKHVSQKAGMPPGTLVYVGSKHPVETSIDITSYNPETLSEQSNRPASSCRSSIESGKVCWINVVGLKDSAIIDEIGKMFGIHPLVVEDILNTHQRPKVEFHPNYIYVTLKMLYRSDSSLAIAAEQISLILGAGYVISFQEVREDVFDPIRERLRSSKGRIRTQGADYLFYCLLDAIVDNYFIVLEDVGEGLDSVQDLVLEKSGPATMKRLHSVKKDIIALRRFIWPTREMMNYLEKVENELINQDTKLYIRDVGEHGLRALETVEMYREMATGAFEIHLSSMNNRMNEIMRVLTIISTFFIPLTFIAGIYGMNFKYMPELEVKGAYPALLTFMLLLAIGMAVFFKRKKWL